jgi:hypothetical protein
MSPLDLLSFEEAFVIPSGVAKTHYAILRMQGRTQCQVRQRRHRIRIVVEIFRR